MGNIRSVAIARRWYHKWFNSKVTLIHHEYNQLFKITRVQHRDYQRTKITVSFWNGDAEFISRNNKNANRFR